MPTSELDPATARWLVGDDGLALLATTTAALDAAAGDRTTTVAPDLALVERTRVATGDPARAAAVLAAAIARRRARARWPDADALLFTRESLEQASDPAVAAWRAARYAAEVPHEVWDLCAGVGGDALALAATGARITAVDRDPARLTLLAHNAAARGLDITTVEADVLTVAPATSAWLHADPARRRDGRRVTALADTVPPVDALLGAHAGACAVGVVIAPGVDERDPALPPDAEVEYIQLRGRLVEAVLWHGELANGRATATLLPGGHQLRRAGARSARLPVGDPGVVLVEVAPAAIRARLHDELGATIGARRLASSRALLTADAAPPASPWYVAREIVVVLPARTKPLARWLRDAAPSMVELVLHGVDVDPDVWWRAVGRPPRGPDGLRVELVRRDRDTIAIVTKAQQVTAAPSG